MIDAPADAIAELERRVRFEAFIADCAARFSVVQLPPDLEREIEASLRQLLALLDADRCALIGGVAGDVLSWISCAAYRGPATPSFGAMNFAASFPWHFARLCQGAEPLAVVRFDELPPEAEPDRRTAAAMGVRSMLAAPAGAGNAHSHCLVLQSLGQERSWPAAWVARLPVLARVLVHALGRHRLEETRRVEARHVDVLESVGAILWRADARTFQTTFVSREAEVILGYPLESWTKVPNFWLDHVHPDDREWVAAFSASAVRERRQHDFEYRMIVADGRTIWVRNIVKVIVEDGEAIALVGVTVEITERKRVEFEAAQLRYQLAHAARVTSLGELAATLAHELNQPLGAMVSNAEAARMLLDAGPPPVDRLRAILDDIAEDGQRAGEIVHRVRMFLQKQPFEMRPLDIGQLVFAVVGLASPLALSRQIELAIDLQPPLASYGDSVQIQQVLLNVLLNAIEAVGDQPPGARHIVVRGARHGAHVAVSVSDSGRGIPPEVLPHVFDPFFTTRTAGMGMGLAICRTIVEAHGGHIGVENNPGLGATVRFTLPAGTMDEEAAS